MRTPTRSRTVRIAALAIAAVMLFALVPAGAQVPGNAACTKTAGKTVVTPDTVLLLAGTKDQLDAYDAAFGYEAVAAPFAVDLGIAMQLTNIARDVFEDAERGRRYLPADMVEGAHAQAGHGSNSHHGLARAAGKDHHAASRSRAAVEGVDGLHLVVAEAPRFAVGRGLGHPDVEGVAVVCQCPRDEPVVSRIVARRIQVPIKLHQASQLVHFELTPPPFGDFNDGIEDAQGTVMRRDVVEVGSCWLTAVVGHWIVLKQFVINGCPRSTKKPAPVRGGRWC